MELAQTHVGRAVDDCTADLQVPVFLGFLIECVLTCACRIVSRALGELEPKFASAIDSFFATSMVILGKLFGMGNQQGMDVMNMDTGETHSHAMSLAF